MRAACAAAFLASMLVSSARADQVNAEKAASIKAAYLLNFIKYTQWPAESFQSESSPIIISVVGRCGVAEILTELAPRSTAATGRNIQIDVPALPGAEDGQQSDWTPFYEHLKAAHLVYLCGLELQSAEAILRGLGSSDKLTVGDIPAFAERGGMLGFVLRDNRILFEANLEAIRKSRIELSAKVLQLAQIVGEEKR